MASTVLNSVYTITPQTTHTHNYIWRVSPKHAHTLLLILPLNSESDRHSSSNQTKFPDFSSDSNILSTDDTIFKIHVWVNDRKARWKIANTTNNWETMKIKDLHRIVVMIIPNKFPRPFSNCCHFHSTFFHHHFNRPTCLAIPHAQEWSACWLVLISNY